MTFAPDLLYVHLPTLPTASAASYARLDVAVPVFIAERALRRPSRECIIQPFTFGRAASERTSTMNKMQGPYPQ